MKHLKRGIPSVETPPFCFNTTDGQKARDVDEPKERGHTEQEEKKRAGN